MCPARVVIPVGNPVSRRTHKFASPCLASRDLEVDGSEMDTFGRGLRWNE
jgi:hypothetical protein